MFPGLDALAGGVDGIDDDARMVLSDAMIRLRPGVESDVWGCGVCLGQSVCKNESGSVR